MLRMWSFRVAPCIFRQQMHHSCPTAQSVTNTMSSGHSDKLASEEKRNLPLEQDKDLSQGKYTLVAAAFDKLNTLQGSEVEIKDSITKLISEAKDVESLLSVISVKKLTRSHALKVVAKLAEWTTEGKVKTTDFEKDLRFAHICKVLGNSTAQTVQEKSSADLNTVLDVKNDDQAAKLISGISLPQMVKVLSSLASRKRRSTPLLRSLAHNIASNTEKLDIKQGADALYAVASLNYHDEMLIDKICSDLCLCLMANSRRAVVGSIITSLGMLRYKHLDLLNLLCEWVQAHKEVCNTQDISSLIMTLAVVNHLPANEESLFPLILEQLQANGVPNPLEWLDVVWAMSVLNKQSTQHVTSVLSSDFIDKVRAISPDGLNVPARLKLLNINGVAKLRIKDYKGPLLDLSSEEWNVPPPRSKEKQALVTTMQETMLNLLPSAVYLGTNIDSGMGFLIDAECIMNSKLTPLPLFDKKTKAPIDRSSSDTQRGIKVAILVLDYHDTTRGRQEPSGMAVLCQDLTRLNGCRIMCVDYLDFNPRHKLVNRVQYLNNQLKSAIGKS